MPVKKTNFPFIAFGLGLFLMGILVVSGAAEPGAELALPLLTVLIVSEFGFIIMAVAVFLGSQTLASSGFEIVLAIITLLCGMMGVEFMLIGVAHWP